MNAILTPAVPLQVPARPAGLPQKLSSEQLLGSRGELVIVHNGREYRLRITQNGRLILTA
jgi:hemin uptake protein HemP